MAEKREAKQPTHRAYSVIRRAGQDDFWLNLGLVFPHTDGSGFNIMLQALPLDGKIVCREISEDDKARAQEPAQLRSTNAAWPMGSGTRPPAAKLMDHEILCASHAPGLAPYLWRDASAVLLGAKS